MNNNDNKWSGIEKVEYDPNNYVQMGFRNTMTVNGVARHYLVSGKVDGVSFTEEYDSDFIEQNKTLAYDKFREVEDLLHASV